MRNLEDPAGRSRRARSNSWLLLLAITLVLVVPVPDGPAQQPAWGAPPDSVQEEEYEILRRLLGVLPPVGAPENSVPKSQAGPADDNQEGGPGAAVEPATADDAPAPAPKKTRPAATPKPSAPAKKKSAGAATASQPAAKTAPKPTVVQQRKESTTPPRVARSTDAVPEAGTVVTASDLVKWKHLMGPSIQWALQRGAALKVVEPRSIPMEAARARATDRYRNGVTLNADKTDMKNYVAGIPFPDVEPSDPDAGIKVMLNQQSRIIVDDLDARHVACDAARILDGRGIAIDKRYVTDHWRRLSYIGRLYNSPKPTWSTIDGVRYRESQFPFTEPVDLKGGGWTSTRYVDPARLDEVWLYNPTVGRVRRMSTAQRSQGMFAQDMDIDSLSGFSANPAWTQWRSLGTKTILAPMNVDHSPVQWQQPPSDFLFDEGWEPREVHVVVGRSRLPEYGSADRVIYVDRESFLVPYTEIYDMKGQLWRAMVLAWSFGSKNRPELGAERAEEFYLPGYTMIDLEIAHVTRCEIPDRNAAGEEGWYYNQGTAGKVTAQSFDVSNFGVAAR